VRASLDYFGAIRVVRVVEDTSPCPLLLRIGERPSASATIAPEWHIIWEYRHGGGKRQELYRLYRRTPS